jgi:LysM repeat protein
MNDTPAIVDSSPGMRSAPVPRAGRHASGSTFSAALADAQAAAKPATDKPAEAGGSTHLVRSGETLYGIARARLAQAGQAATPAATMRHALEIAQTNHIRNPDRIYAGQTLQLSAPAAASVADGRAAFEAAKAAAYAGGMGTSSVEAEPAWAADAVDLPDETVEHAHAAGHAVDPTQAQPIVPGPAAAAEIKSDVAIQSRPGSVEKARADLALYRQSAPAAASTPSADVPDVLYKGVVGKALEMVPLEPSTRTGLQQANAVISGSLAGRSLAALTGFGGPLLTVAGLLWGIFSAHKIGAEQSAAATPAAQNTNVAKAD